MANALTLISKKRAISNRIVFVFKCVLSGSYSASSGAGTPGETLAFNSASNPNFIARPKIPSTLNGSTGNLPNARDFNIPNPLDGYSFRIERNASSPTAQNFVLRIFASGGSELSSGSYPAALADTDGVNIELTVPLKND